MKPEQRLHLLAPYLPTDRFRALLRHVNLPITTQGAALMVDISGFTPLTIELVAKYEGRAGEELRRRINPMFEAIAGQVFHFGGSVIRFLGDGFTAWFDDAQSPQDGSPPVPGALRAAAAGLGIQEVMRLWRALKIKVCIGVGVANRWVVGLPKYGLSDVLSGPAVAAMLSLIGEAQPEQVIAHRGMLPLLRGEGIRMEITDTGNAMVTGLSDDIARAARKHRWGAWAAEGDVQAILREVSPYVGADVRGRLESGTGDFGDELRNALPMFMQVNIAANAPDPQAALNHYVCRAQEQIDGFGGRLMSVEVSDKGSVLFAVFGAPTAYGDDAERALRFALNMREKAADMPAIEWQCIGISRGLLYAGTVGGEVRHEYSAIGDETNIAARLMGAAEPGQVLVTSAVRKASGARILFRDLKEIFVKGRPEAIPIFEPMGIRASEARTERAGGFVGRETEVSILRRMLAAVQSGYPRMIDLEGDAGIGKSRLIAEFAAQAENLRVGRGECISAQRTVSYLPWQMLLFSLFELNPDVGPERNAASLAEDVIALLPGSQGRMPLLGEVLHLPFEENPTTIRLEGRTRQEAIFALITELLLSFSRRQALLLIIEDVQWMDELSAALLIDLARRLTVDPAPVLIALTRRAAPEEKIPALLATALGESHYYLRMALGELTHDETRRAIELHLDAHIEDDLADFVYERTQGNPFYVNELLDALMEARYVRKVSHSVYVVQRLQDVRLPQTVRELVQARIDRLGELDKLVLKVAAVIGREFDMRVLAESLPVQMDGAELARRLSTLETHDFVAVTESGGGPIFRFRHAITQEVIYEGLLGAQREMLHQAVASGLERHMPDEIERLAHHYALGRDTEKAWQYLVLSGQKAVREYANSAALNYFLRALPISRDAEERFIINRQIVQVLLRLGEMAQVAERLPEMARLAEVENRPAWAADVHLAWANYYTQISALPDALREAQQAITLAEQVDDDALAWDGYMLLRDAMLTLNLRDQVVRSNLDLRMQNIADRLGDTRHTIGLLLTQFDDMYAENPEMAIQGAHTALFQAEGTRNPLLVADCYAVLADLYLREQDLPAAYETTAKQRTVLHQIGDRRREALAMNRLGSLLIGFGQVSEASDVLQDAYQILHQIGERAGKAVTLLNLGLIAMLRGAHDESMAYINRAQVSQEELHANADLALTLFHKGGVMLNTNALDEAETAFEKAGVLLEANRRVRHGLTRLEVESGAAMVDLARGHHATARIRMAPMLLRLSRRQIAGLFAPTLAYYRGVTLLEKLGERDAAETLRGHCQVALRPLFKWLEGQGWKDGFLANVRHHMMLFRAGPPPASA